MNMISQNVQVILVVDPTMQGNDGTEIIPRYDCPNRASLWEGSSQGCRIPWSASIHKLTLQLGKEKNGIVGEYRSLPLVCRLALVISTPLQPLLNVDSGEQRFPDAVSSMISKF